jgi:hypothetical protein
MDLVSYFLSSLAIKKVNFNLFTVNHCYANSDARLLSRTFRALHELVLVLGFGEAIPKGKLIILELKLV